MVNTESRVWPDSGVEPTQGDEVYTGRERPIAEYDNWAMWAVTKDIDTIASILGSLEAIESVTEVRYETLSERPAAGTAGRVSILTDEQRVTVDDGSEWLNVGVQSHDDLANIVSDDHHTRPEAGDHLDDESNVFNVQPETIDAADLDGSSGTDGQVLQTDGDMTTWGDIDTRTDEEIEDVVAALVAAGANLAWTYDDANDTLTIDTNALNKEEVEDAVNALLTAGSNLTLNYDDGNDELTIALTDDITISGEVAASTVSATDELDVPVYQSTGDVPAGQSKGALVFIKDNNSLYVEDGT